ncbi:MAG: hypothetical protein AAGU14_00090 [Eubacteriaceae bacterium]
MANYNTFVVVDCTSRKSILTTSSARKAIKELKIGTRIDIWNSNSKINTIYSKNREDIKPYIKLEKEYIGRKQAAAEKRNKGKSMVAKGSGSSGRAKTTCGAAYR